jgi:hypothetical protein
MTLTDVHHQSDPTEAQVGTATIDSAPSDPTIDLTAPSPTRPQFTITEAATACAVSRKTITRKLADLAEHGAAKDDDGVWRIPVEALLAVGLHPGRSVPEQRPVDGSPRNVPTPPEPSRTAERVGVPAPDVVTIPRERWDDLRIRLARAEAEAAERALALADARLALRALTAGPGSVGAAGAPRPAIPVAEPRGGRPDAPGSVQAGGGASGSGPDGGATAPAPAPEPVVPGAQGSGTPAAMGSPAGPDPRSAARAQAAQTGGYVPAPGAPRRRRWWQGKQR